jgi:hypothetical protein
MLTRPDRDRTSAAIITVVVIGTLLVMVASSLADAVVVP